MGSKERCFCPPTGFSNDSGSTAESTTGAACDLVLPP